MVFDNAEETNPNLERESMHNPRDIPSTGGAAENPGYPQPTLPDVAFISPDSINSEFEIVSSINLKDSSN